MNKIEFMLPYHKFVMDVHIPSEIIIKIFNHALLSDRRRIYCIISISRRYYIGYYKFRHSSIRNNFTYQETLGRFISRDLIESEDSEYYKRKNKKRIIIRPSSVCFIMWVITLMRCDSSDSHVLEPISFSHNYLNMSILFTYTMTKPLTLQLIITLGKSYLCLIYIAPNFILYREVKYIDRIIGFLKLFMPELYNVLRLGNMKFDNPVIQ